MTGGRRSSPGSSSSERRSSTQIQSRSPSGGPIAQEKINLESAAAGEAQIGEHKVIGSPSDFVTSQAQSVVDKGDQEPVCPHFPMITINARL